MRRAWPASYPPSRRRRGSHASRRGGAHRRRSTHTWGNARASIIAYHSDSKHPNAPTLLSRNPGNLLSPISWKARDLPLSPIHVKSPIEPHASLLGSIQGNYRPRGATKRFKIDTHSHWFGLPAIGRGNHPNPFRTRKLNHAPFAVVVLSSATRSRGSWWPTFFP